MASEFAPDLTDHRKHMVEAQLIKRGIRDPRVLKAMEEVPRHAFVGVELAEFAYDDAPLPIEEGQTISQPYIVALMAQLIAPSQRDRVLEIGTGSGYAAAVLSRLVKEVFTVERHASLARLAESRFAKLGYSNIHVLCGDGTLGWLEHAPYDAIIVAAGGPDIPRPLIDQLEIGGKLIMPTGPVTRLQKLVRVRRVSESELTREDLGPVRFVPLVGREGWPEDESGLKPSRPRTTSMPFRYREPFSSQLVGVVEPFTDTSEANTKGLLERVGDARVVLLGEATHGTAEFYEMRARITQALIEQKGFNIVAVEADWPDAAQVDHFVRQTRDEPTEEPTFSRFPTWMWANAEVLAFVQWLRHYNTRYARVDDRVGFYGLDLYSLYASIGAVVAYLDDVDPAFARVARTRYGCLTPWEDDPATYGASAMSGRHRGCEKEAVAILEDLLSKRLEYAKHDGRRFLDAFSNARLVANAERYYRLMYYGSHVSWNLRDQHMFDTLATLLEYHGSDAKAVVWEHNSHIGDATATEMSARGEHNVGQLCRERFGSRTRLVGFGTDHGTVAAANDWGGPVEFKRIRPSHPESYERICHDTDVPNFILDLGPRDFVRKRLLSSRLERAIGVIYRPETELQSHYFHAVLPRQFDEYIWIDETRPVSPLGPESGVGLPDTFPFGL